VVPAILRTLLSFLQTYALFLIVLIVFGALGLWQALRGRLGLAVILALLAGAVFLVRAIR
jgi:hypothetical protein